MNDHQINLSIIREDKELNHDNEGLDELLKSLRSPKKSFPQSEIDIQQSDEQDDVMMDKVLTAKLKMIKRYVQAQRRIDLGEYLLRKFKNLVRCVQIHQTTLKEDYYLLFEILLATCRRSSAFKQFLHHLSIATSKRQSQEASCLVQDYLEIIYHLIRIKMAGYEDRNSEVARLKGYCIKIRWKAVQGFPFKDILRNHFDYYGEVKNLQSLSGLMNEYRQVKLKIESKQVQISLKLQNQAEQTKEGSQKLQFLKPKQQISKLIEQIQQDPHLNKQIQDSINGISIRQIKQLSQGRTILRKLLHLSFKHLKLMSSSIEKALYVFQIQEFINEIKHLFELNSSSQNLAEAKRLIKKQLKNYCGKDSLYYWSKIQS